jgi:hypothetical protein
MAACDAFFLRNILAFAGHEQLWPTTLFMDNDSAIDVSKDPKHFAKSKHIERRDLFIRELVVRGIITTKYMPTVMHTTHDHLPNLGCALLPNEHTCPIRT